MTGYRSSVLANHPNCLWTSTSVFCVNLFDDIQRSFSVIDCHPYKVDVPERTLDEIRRKVAAFPWHEMPNDGGWEYGTNLDYMKLICDYWVDQFDWRAQEEKINRFPHFTAPVNGLETHFIHERGSGPNPKPLILSHGWPGSIVEFLEFIDLLAHPENHGGSIDDAFDVVAPALPGFGFSERPPRPFGPRKMAAQFNTLMTDVLGYDRYIAQGGDWGGAIISYSENTEIFGCSFADNEAVYGGALHFRDAAAATIE